MDEYGMNEFEMIKKSDVMRIINAENAVVLNGRKERSTDEVLCAIASQINGLQTTSKSGSRLIDADAFSQQYGNYYAEEGTAEGFIGTVGELIAKQPTIEAEPVRHGRWERHSSEQIECLESGIYRILSTARCSVCRRWAEHVDDIEKIVTYDVCPNCGAKMGE